MRDHIVVWELADIKVREGRVIDRAWWFYRENEARGVFDGALPYWWHRVEMMGYWCVMQYWWRGVRIG